MVNVRPNAVACEKWWAGAVCQPLVPPYDCSSDNKSCDEDSVQFLKQCRQLVAEELIRFPEAALLTEGRIVKVVGFDAEAGGDMDEGSRAVVGK